jgi:hypothetical protein
VYRHEQPRDRDRQRTEQLAASVPLLRKYLDQYGAGYADWGDDPAFFSASEVLGSPEHATWGVCRGDVRAALEPDDFVVFFCASQTGPVAWDYHYIGVGTIGAALDRRAVWTDEQYRDYREFLNVLVRFDGERLVQNEFVYPFHDDEPNWERRAEAPCWRFDTGWSRFELKSPVHVASSMGRGVLEDWRLDDKRVAEIARLVLPGPQSSRRLRTVNLYKPHPKLNLAAQADAAGGFNALRARLLHLT